MARDSKSFSRGRPRFKQSPTVLVVCEDSKSNKRYIEDAALYYRANLDVFVHHCGKTDPLGIVEFGVKNSKNYDQVFCVIDRDTHLNFDKAIVFVRDNPKVKAIASYPCFEFWYLLHYGFNNKPYSVAGNKSPADMLIKDLKKCEGFSEYDKSGNLGLFAYLNGERMERAIKAARRVLKEAEEGNGLNPSTEAHVLVEFIKELKSPKLLV